MYFECDVSKLGELSCLLPNIFYVSMCIYESSMRLDKVLMIDHLAINVITK